MATADDEPSDLPVNESGEPVLDPVLLQCLNNPRDILLVLKLDTELRRFVENREYVSDDRVRL